MPGRPAVVIGLDVGTSGVKAAAFGPGGRFQPPTIRQYPLLEPKADEHTQDADTVVAAAVTALAGCVAAARGADVIGVALSTAMHGLMALDGELRPITPLVTWADGRAREEARWLHQTGQAATLHAQTGAPVHPMTPLTKLLWFARHDPATWAAARWWVGLKEYVLLRLTGTLATELSSASGTGLLDLSAGTWSAAALDVCGLDAGRLPAILPTTATLPLAAATAADVGLPAGTPVVVGAGDGPLANLGAGAVTPGVAGLSLGTSGAVRMVVADPRVDAAGRLFCYALTESDWVIGGAISNGASVVRWAAGVLAADLATPSDERLLELAARVPPGSDGVVMLPYLLPERAPLWDADLPGAYVGLRWRHGRAHLVRAAVEGVALQMRLIADALDDAEPVTSVRATGGAFRSPLWREIMAAALGRPFVVVGQAEGTAFGAAALGLVGVGYAATPSEALTMLSDPAAPEPPVVPTDRAVVAAYERLRASVPALVAQLDSVAALFPGAGAVSDAT